MIRTLGIDPGSRITGFGVIEQRGRTSCYVASGCIRVGQYPLQERLKRIFEGLSEIIKEYQPQVVALEKIFVHKNVASALKLGQARGVALVAAALSELHVAEYTPRYIKKTVTGYGAADKKQVQQMIKTIFKLDGLPPPDASDALAVALCHAYLSGGIQ
jgi:crossover junction endodeoxyribonuclease RuvC